tara:strand:- start:174 stop:380 length:207 start_codon:yes stop_codon:yes gene_type:complete
VSKPKAFLGINADTMKCSMVADYSAESIAEAEECDLIIVPCTIEAAQKHFNSVVTGDMLADAVRGAFQ